MASIQYRIWHLILKIALSSSRNSRELDIEKSRGYDVGIPPAKAGKKFRIGEKTFEERKVFTLTAKAGISKSKVILYFHGGAYISGPNYPHWLFVRRLAIRTGMPVIMPYYPLAPEHSWKETLQFCIRLYKDTMKAYPGAEIYLMGDSAGGGLALSLSQQIKTESLPQPHKILAFSPWLDLSMTHPEILHLQKHDIMLNAKLLMQSGQLYAGGLDVKDPRISPLFADLNIFPELHIFTGTYDILNADALEFRKRAHEAGISLGYYQFPKMIHCWMLLPVPESERVIQQVLKILGDQKF